MVVVVLLLLQTKRIQLFSLKDDLACEVR